MKQTFYIFIFNLFSNFVISQNSLVEKKELYPNGKVFAIGKVQYSQKQGLWNYYDQKGILIEKAKFVNGNKYYVDKWENGKQVVFKGNGNVSEYYYNGHIKEKGKVKEGKKHGLWTEYFINGLYKSELEYKYWASPCNNNIFNLCIVKISYDKNKNIICKDGIGYYEYLEDSGKVYQIDFITKNGRDSIYYFYPNQKLSSIQFINKNKYDIAETLKEFYPNGKIRYESLKSKDTTYKFFYNLDGIKLSETKVFLNKEIKYTYNEKGLLINRISDYNHKSKLIYSKRQILT